MSEASISVRNLQKSFGDTHAVENISFDVERGTVLGVLGPNGAGKTTTLRMLATLLPPDAGSATIEGFDVLTHAAEVRYLIGLAGQYAAVDEHLTGRENLVMVARLYHQPYRKAVERADELLRVFDLAHAADRPLKTYSGGMRRRLDLAASLVNSPPVLFLDEPTTGLDPESRRSLWRIIRELVAAGTTVLLTTQYLEEADHLADRIIVIDKGRVVEDGTPQELKEKVGEEVLQVRIADIAQVNKAAAALRSAGAEQVKVDIALQQLTVPLSGIGLLPKAVRAMDVAHIAIEDLEVRKASLDEVFLKLTGHHAHAEGDTIV
jgi:ABC-2 type transport system ATP-binding protein